MTWTFPDAASTPTGCGQGSTGTNTYQVVTTTPMPAPAGVLTNQATFSGTGPDATNSAGITGSTNTGVPIRLVDTPSPTAGDVGYPTMSKSSLGPLAITSLPGNQYEGTFAGDWLNPSATPTYTVGAAAGSYQVNVAFPLTATYQADIVDPLPCLSNTDGSGDYFSNAPGTTCADPAFHTQVIQVSGNGVNLALGDGVWQPSVTTTGGVVVPLILSSSSGSSAYYDIPAGLVGSVASLDVPPDSNLEGPGLTLTMWGYADSTLQALNELDNTATVTPVLGGTRLGPLTDSADLFIVAPKDQLGISKSFGRLGAGPGGTTAVNIGGAVNIPPGGTLADDIVLTDLLPTGLTWASTATSGSFTLTQGDGTTTGVTGTAAYFPNYEGTGRSLVRITIPAADFDASGNWLITPPANFLTVQTPSANGTYPNTDQIFVANQPTNALDTACTTPTQTGGGTSPAMYESDNPFDLAGDGRIQTSYCQNSATLVVAPSGAAFNLTKTVQGDQDAAAKGAGGIGDATLGGSGTYVLNWTNTGNDALNDAVVYDILPFVGDTGVSEGQQGVARDSQFQPVFASVAALPAGVTVEYSESTNPCRPEVSPNDTTCVDDWSPNLPADLADVAALKLVSTNTYTTGQSFAVTFNVTVPDVPAIANKIAWNSAATNATDVDTPSTTLLPAEPPKVGLVAPTAGTPSVSTTTSATTATAYSTTPITDAVNLVGTGGAPGTLDWSFVGPVAPVGGSCVGLDWTGAPLVVNGSTAAPAADVQITTGPASVAGQGCYSWVDTYTPTAGTAVTLPAGSDGEVVQALPFQTTLATSPSIVTSAAGDKTVADSVTVGSSGLGSGPGAPTTTQLQWTLYGPVPAIAGSCANIPAATWDAAVKTTNTQNVGAGTSATTPSVPITAASLAYGCYSFGDALSASTAGTGVNIDPGTAAETFQLVPPPAVATQAPTTVVQPRTAATDSVTLSLTGGQSGHVAWTMVGPILPLAGSCQGLDWTGAPTNATGTTNFTGDRTVSTTGGKVAGVGCYSWNEVITGTNFLGATTVAAGSPNEELLVTPYQPTLATAAAMAVGPAGSRSATDTVVVSASDLGTGGGAPASATLTWNLYGPVAPIAGSCTAVDWTGAPVVSATLAASNGSNVTPTTAVTAAGCYTYTDSLAPSADTLAVPETPQGVPAETFLLLAAPAVTTQVPATSVAPRSAVSDSITVTGGPDATGQAGTVTWTLVELPLVTDCATITDWSTAATVAGPTMAATQLTSTATVLTTTATAQGLGCYSWVDTFDGPAFLGETSVPAGTPGEVFTVTPVVPTLVTTASSSANNGVESATDAVVVSGTDLGGSAGAPTSADLTWQLLGPEPPVAGGCATVDWSATPPADGGAITVIANGPQITTATPLIAGECYTYTAHLDATQDSSVVDSEAGQVAETVLAGSDPQVSTTSSESTVFPHASVSDQVAVTDNGASPRALDWSLVGPVAPINGSCATVDWTGAVAVPGGTGSAGVTADGTVTTGPVTVDLVGCYSWVDHLGFSTTAPGDVAVTAGASGELVLVQPHAPTLATTAEVETATGGSQSVTDTVVVAGSGIGIPGAPASAPLTWSLVGPVPPVNASCAAVDWTPVTPPVTTVASGTITVTGDGSYPVPPTPLLTNGCYSYTESLAATADSLPATSEVGATGESVQAPAPAVSTTTSAPTVRPFTGITDSIDITGTLGHPGSLAWSLVGPMAPIGGTCTTVDWSTAMPLTGAAGTISVTGDGTSTAGPVRVVAPGCYSWVDTLSDPAFGESGVLAGATNEVVLVQPFDPSITTGIVQSATTAGLPSLADRITIAGSGIAAGAGSASSLALTWTLFGPTAPVAGSCTGVAWTGQPVAATGTIEVTADGVYTTPATAIHAAGCYTFDEALAGSPLSSPATTAPGDRSETALITITATTPPTTITPTTLPTSGSGSGSGPGPGGTIAPTAGTSTGSSGSTATKQSALLAVTGLETGSLLRLTAVALVLGATLVLVARRRSQSYRPAHRAR